MNDDELERRLRGALGRPRPGDGADTDDFLSRVHHGAKVRRVKRGVAVAAASVLAVTGGGLAVNASGLLGGSRTPIAADRTTVPGTLGTQSSSTPPPSTAATQPSASKRTRSSQPTFGQGPITIQISPKNAIAAKDVKPVSLTATGRAHQWVLAKTPNTRGDCDSSDCASVFSTSDHGAAWKDLGQLTAPPASPDAPSTDSVSQLRFTKRNDTTYDGWAYGYALWATHDSGRTWSTDGAPSGQVTVLESWGTDVYAGVSSPVPGDDTATLYRSPTSSNDWQPVDIAPQGLTSIDALAAANGVVALIDGGQQRPTVYLSRTGDTDTWQRETPCPQGTNPSALSSAGDGTVGALWVTCQGLSQAIARVTDTTDLGHWSTVPSITPCSVGQVGCFPATATLAAQSPTLAFLAGAGVTGIQSIPRALPVPAIPGAGVGAPVMFGFTNPTHGYLLDAYGTILSTTDGGFHWVPYAVSDTSP